MPKVLTVTKAKALADSMSAEARDVIRSYSSGKGGNFSQASVEEVIRLRLIECVENLLNNSLRSEMVWVLTADGKKLAKVL